MFVWRIAHYSKIPRYATADELESIQLDQQDEEEEEEMDEIVINKNDYDDKFDLEED
jgi:hypothetical protein